MGRFKRLLAFGGLGAAARGVSAGATVGLDVRAGSLVLWYGSVDILRNTCTTTNTYRHVECVVEKVGQVGSGYAVAG